MALCLLETIGLKRKFRRLVESFSDDWRLRHIADCNSKRKEGVFALASAHAVLLDGDFLVVCVPGVVYYVNHLCEMPRWERARRLCLLAG